MTTTALLLTRLLNWKKWLPIQLSGSGGLGGQVGDGMGGGRRGRFWGAPILAKTLENTAFFQNRGSGSYHHPSHPPLDALLPIAGQDFYQTYAGITGNHHNLRI